MALYWSETRTLLSNFSPNNTKTIFVSYIIHYQHINFT